LAKPKVIYIPVAWEMSHKAFKEHTRGTANSMDIDQMAATQDYMNISLIFNEDALFLLL